MSQTTIKPLGDRVLLEIRESAEQMKGGILIPDTAKEKPQEYTVIALGTGKLDDKGAKIPFDVKVGDEGILFGSVTAAHLAEALGAQGIEVDRKSISVDPVKTIGAYEATVKIYKGIGATIKFEVVAEE